MTEAWTPVSSCSAEPAQALLGGAAPYWVTLSFDARGNRVSEQASTASATTSRVYTYGSAAGQPDALTSVVSTGSVARTDTFGYDASGNTTTRAIGAASQTLTWDELGKAATTAAGSLVTRYFYDADGTRIARTDPAAASATVAAAGVTVFVGGAEVHLGAGASSATATRYYAFDGKTVAARTAGGVKVVMADHQGTAQVQIDQATGVVLRRYSLPFGGDRSTVLGGSAASSVVQPAGWAGLRSFVGGTQDEGTGLVSIGARLYDAGLGRFVSADPVFDGSNPQSWNGYAYAGNAPVTHSDPTGLCYFGGDLAAIAACAGHATGNKNATSEQPKEGPTVPFKFPGELFPRKKAAAPRPVAVAPLPYWQMRPKPSGGGIGILKSAGEAVGNEFNGMSGAVQGNKGNLNWWRLERLGRSPLIRVGGPTSAVVTAGLDATERMEEGESTGKAITKAGVSAGLGAAGAWAGAEAGAAGGAVAGGAIGTFFFPVVGTAVGTAVGGIVGGIGGGIAGGLGGAWIGNSALSWW